MKTTTVKTTAVKTTILHITTRLDRYLFNKVLTNYDSRANQVLAGIAQSFLFSVIALCESGEPEC